MCNKAETIFVGAKTICVAAILMIFYVFSFASTIPVVPDKKPIGTYVVDLSKLFRKSTISHLNSYITEVKKKSGAEIYVVTVDSIYEQNVLDVVKEINEKWQSCNKISEDCTIKSIVILLVRNEGFYAFSTSPNMENVLTNKFIERTMTTFLLPTFNNGRIGEGIEDVVLIFADKIARDANVSLELNVPPDPYYRASSIEIVRDIGIGHPEKNEYSPQKISVKYIIISAFCIFFIGILFGVAGTLICKNCFKNKRFFN